MLHQTLGYTRTFDFDLPHVQVGDDLDVSDFQGAVRLTRATQGLYAAGTLHAVVRAECVRCLTPFDQVLTIAFDELFSFPPSTATDSLLSIPETGLLDLTPLAREYLLLDFPLQPLCRPDCRGLCPECGANRNETTCAHDTVTIDPRLQGLRALLDDSP
jgi:uncharacterized protein